MEKTKINLTVNDLNEKPVVVHLLQGEAPPHHDPEQLKISGNINAVTDFILTRENEIDKKKSFILFNEKDRKITLTVNEDSHIPTVVTAQMEVHPDLEQFGINAKKYRSRTEMEALIRMYRFYFPDKDAHLKLNADFKAFSAKVQQEIISSSDQRGNKNNTHIKNVQSDLVADFVLDIPLFKGGQRRSFLVEICFEVTDSAPRFWLESVELFELQMEFVHTAFEEQAKTFIEKDFTVINS